MRQHTAPLLSAKELAEFLGISRSTIYSWVHQGILPPPIQVGGVSRWRQEDAEGALGKRKLRKPKRPGEPAA